MFGVAAAGSSRARLSCLWNPCSISTERDELIVLRDLQYVVQSGRISSLLVTHTNKSARVITQPFYGFAIQEGYFNFKPSRGMKLEAGVYENNIQHLFSSPPSPVACLKLPFSESAEVMNMQTGSRGGPSECGDMRCGALAISVE